MREIDVLKNKVNLIIEKYPNIAEIEQFKLLLKKLNKIDGNSMTIYNNSFFSRIISSMRSTFFKPNSKEFDEELYGKVKNEIIKLYKDSILKKENHVKIENLGKYADAYCSSNYGLGTDEKLHEEINKYLKSYTRLKEKKDGVIEVYPWRVKEYDLENMLNKEYEKVSEYFLTTQKSEIDSFNEVTCELKDKNKKIKDIFMKSEIKKYYGSPEFIYERSQYILQCMEEILSNKDVKQENKIKTIQLIEQAKIVVEKIRKFKEMLDKEENNIAYDEMIVNFEKLLSNEDIISKDVEKIWNEFLTNPKDYKEGERFAFLVHAYTDGIVEKEKLNKCCCTLVTEKCMPIPYSNIGIVCGYCADNIGVMCTEDAGSWTISKEYFLDRGIPIDWQFAESCGIDDRDKRVFYEEAKISKLILPSTMEENMLKNNEIIREKFGNSLNYGAYTEIYMVKGKNEKRIPVQAMFYTDEKGKEKLEGLEIDVNAIKLDPSKATEIPLYKENSNEIGIEIR